MKRVIRLLLIATATYAAAGVLLYLARHRIIFPVRGGLAGEPARFGLPDGVPVMIPTGDGDTLAGWFLPAPSPGTGRVPLLVWFHGNAETVAGLAPVLREFRPADAALLAVDFRGYGASSGRATVANTERDALAVWAWLAERADVDTARIVVYGRSIGTGPAVALAAQRPAAGLVLESAFTSLRDLARHHYPMFPSGLAGGGFDNQARIGDVRSPILFIHGDRDATVPIAMGRALAARVGSRGALHVIPGADHNETYDMGGEAYVQWVREFVDRVAAPGRT